MALSREQRAELESRGADNVRQKLFESGSGRGAVVRGFKCGEIERGEVEDWLAEKANRTARIAFAPSELAVFADRCPIDQLKHVIVRAGDGEGRHSAVPKVQASSCTTNPRVKFSALEEKMNLNDPNPSGSKCMLSCVVLNPPALR